MLTSTRRHEAAALAPLQPVRPDTAPVPLFALVAAGVDLEQREPAAVVGGELFDPVAAVALLARQRQHARDRRSGVVRRGLPSSAALAAHGGRC